MLRSLFSGISGLRAHQTMLDVTGNNIANVNTAGFKSSQTQFQDTLSQVLADAGGARPLIGGTNPAQVGLGVRVAGITTNFQQGSSQLTNRSTDMMINGDGFFTVRNGNEQMYTRGGSFNFDSLGQLVTADGSLVQGYAADADGVVDVAAGLDTLRMPIASLVGGVATTQAKFGGNLPLDADADAVVTESLEVYDELGTPKTLAVAFTRAGGTWTVTATLDDEAPVAQALVFSNGELTGDRTVDLPGGLVVDLSAVTEFPGNQTVAGTSRNGQEAGSLQSFSLRPDGMLVGSFSNGMKQSIGQVALANFVNPTGLSKAGNSLYRPSVSSGEPMVGTPGSGGRGTLAGGALEMSNVDLSTEFTNLIVAQRGFQANSRVITTSDELLQELVNLKR